MFRPTLLLLLAIAAPKAPKLPAPIAVFELPTELTEVSGLTDLDDHTVACLQDEAATLYVLDLADGKVRERHPFGPPGDMEGLTRVGQDLLALRSDGLVYQLQLRSGRYVATDSFLLQLPNRNIEGLGYDERTQRVIVSPKDQSKGAPDGRDIRQLFAFDPVTHALLPDPEVTFSVSDILAKAKADGVVIPTRTTPKGREVPMLKIRMASVAIDPISDHYFILSAVDRILFEMDRAGAYVHLHMLDAELLPKPEGITFLPNGDMLISTEGKGGPPRLVRYAANDLPRSVK